jgi:hypothetical protein
MKRRNLKKVRDLIEKNKEVINRIIASNQFMIEIKEHSKYVKFESVEGEDEEDIWLLYDLPIVISPSMTRGLVLELIDGQYVVLDKI